MVPVLLSHTSQARSCLNAWALTALGVCGHRREQAARARGNGAAVHRRVRVQADGNLPDHPSGALLHVPSPGENATRSDILTPLAFRHLRQAAMVSVRVGRALWVSGRGFAGSVLSSPWTDVCNSWTGMCDPWTGLCNPWTEMGCGVVPGITIAVCYSRGCSKGCVALARSWKPRARTLFVQTTSRTELAASCI